MKAADLSDRLRDISDPLESLNNLLWGEGFGRPHDVYYFLHPIHEAMQELVKEVEAEHEASRAEGTDKDGAS